jgi:methyl-accepting chemotaxis protein
MRFSLGVRGKVLLLFAISTGFLLAAAGIGFWQFDASLQAFAGDVVVSGNNAVGVVTMEADFKKQVQEWKDTLLRGKQPEALDRHWGNFQQRETDVRSTADRLSRSIADAEATRLVAQFLTAHQEMGDAYRRGLQQFKEHGFDSAVGDKAVAGIDRAPTELLTKARDRLVSLASSRTAEVTASAYRAMWGSAALFGAVVAAAFGMFFVTMHYSVTSPLLRLNSAMRAMADGNLAITIPGLERRDEVGDIAKTIGVIRGNAETEAVRKQEQAQRAEAERAAQRKADMIKLADEFEAAVGEIVGVVSSAATELEASAATLSNTAETAKRLSTVVASASEEASTNVQTVASAAEELTGSVTEIGRQVQESARISGDAVDQARRTDDRVTKLSQAATRIGDVTQLITTIAEQTNLLALNATIEAARAGDAGRGFAVVAQEVKQLASQTATATQEISGQIAEMQSATQDSVGAIKEIGGTIGRISEIATTIASAVEEQGAATQEITRNVQLAAVGTSQVAANISDVSRGATETGAASVQVLSSARTLAEESNRLKLEMGKFLGTVRAA